VSRPFKVNTREIEPVPAPHQQAVADALQAMLADITAAELFEALEAGPDTLGLGPVLLVYEVDLEQRIVTVRRYLWLGSPGQVAHIWRMELGAMVRAWSAAEHPIEDLAGGEPGHPGVDQHEVPRLERVGDAEADTLVPERLDDLVLVHGDQLTLQGADLEHLEVAIVADVPGQRQD
jgi:hypothetical protein